MVLTKVDTGPESLAAALAQRATHAAMPGTDPMMLMDLVIEAVSASIEGDEILVSARVSGSVERPEASATPKGHLVTFRVPAKITKIGEEESPSHPQKEEEDRVG